MTPAALLVGVLADPARATALGDGEWTAVIAAARAELLLGTLAGRVDGLPIPAAVAPILADARDAAAAGRRRALWEAEMTRRALASAGCLVVLLKGAAFVAAGLAAGQGRSIGDLDILVPRRALPAVEAALLGAGWEWLKTDPYDDGYYRRWMHELPPLIHRERDQMIDVHHTILPLTARPRPDAAALVAAAVPLGAAGGRGLSVLSPPDMIVHAAAHLFADGDLAGGLRNLWDIDRLCREFAASDDAFHPQLLDRARRHQLLAPVERALRLARHLYGTPAPSGGEAALRIGDRPFVRRLLARDGWGRPTRPATRLAFYLRSHALRMPPAMLARHLWIKARRSNAAPTGA